MQDKFIKCRRCTSSLCYEQTLPEGTQTWLCLSCGFNTSTHMKVGSEAVKQVYTQSPDLYKELLHEDEEGYVWCASTITVPEVGMVFIDGSTSTDWKWKFVPAVPITDAERAKFPKEQTHRMDLKNSKSFGQNEFGQAMAEIG